MRTRLLAACAALSLLAGGLTACSSDAGAGTEDFPQVTGEVGAKPQIAKGGSKKPTQVKSRVIKAGDGRELRATDTVAVDYLGQTWEGKTFDESYTSKAPRVFALNQLIEGWSEGLTGKHVGDRVEIVVPPAKGYGKDDVKNGSEVAIKGNSTLVFVVDILDSLDTSNTSALTKAKPVADAPVPSWLKVTGKLAEKPTITFTGKVTDLAEQRVIVLAEGKGPEISPTDYVASHITMMTADGKVSQSTYDLKSMQVTKSPAGNTDLFSGVKVGSRILMLAPAEKNEQVNAPVTAYVIDIGGVMAPKRATADK